MKNIVIPFGLFFFMMEHFQAMALSEEKVSQWDVKKDLPSSLKQINPVDGAFG